jgi:hypothetical protein
MQWEVEYTDEFGAWWESLSQDEQISVRAAVEVLGERGPALGRPYVDSIKNSKFPNMKELRARAQHGGEPYRILFAFDPRRAAILLIGGNKVGNRRWYREFVLKADKLYEAHLKTLTDEDHGRG